MDKIWFVLIDDECEGPLDYTDLQNDRRLTPDTLVWRKGLKTWKRIRDVPELQTLFEEGPRGENSYPESEIIQKKLNEGELMLDLWQEPPYFLWILLVLAALSYVMIKLYT